jgi:hypothetical protein
MSRIFISYRRSDSAAYAGRLYDRLRRHFGDAEVFMDLEGIEPGAEFVRVISDKVQTADVLIALIGKDWTTLVGADGRRRLDHPDDLVVREIETALAAQRRVIPVLAGRTNMPARSELPERIAALVDRNAIELSDRHFHADVDRLIKVIDPSSQGEGSRRRLWPLAAAGAIAVAIGGVWVARSMTGPPLAAAPSIAAAQAPSPPPADPPKPAPAAAPTWEQIRALPVIYAESFDPATVLDVWKPLSPPRPPWTEELRDGRYCTINRSDENAVHYIHVEIGKHDLRDAPVFVRVQVEGSAANALAGAGVLYRFDGSARTYYAFVLNANGQATLWRRNREGMQKLFAGTAPGAEPRKPTVIGMAGRGPRLFLYVNEALLATVEDSELLEGQVGAVSFSKGRFCFDDFTVRSAAAR